MRPVPKHIDNKARAIEYLLVFFGTFVLVRSVMPLGALVVGIVMALLYMKGTAGRPDGFLIHTLYMWGIPIRQLISKKVRNLTP